MKGESWLIIVHTQQPYNYESTPAPISICKRKSIIQGKITKEEVDDVSSVNKRLNKKMLVFLKNMESYKKSTKKRVVKQLSVYQLGIHSNLVKLPMIILIVVKATKKIEKLILIKEKFNTHILYKTIRDIRRNYNYQSTQYFTKQWLLRDVICCGK
jgi:hypothetical protein